MLLFFVSFIYNAQNHSFIWKHEQISHQLCTISTHWNINSPLIYTTTKLHIHVDVMNTKFSNSNNIIIWIFIWRVTFIFNKLCSVVLYDYILVCIFVNHSYKWKYFLLCYLNEISMGHVNCCIKRRDIKGFDGRNLGCLYVPTIP